MNKPKSPVNHYHRDGEMPFGLRTNPDAYYEPNSFDGPVEDPPSRSRRTSTPARSAVTTSAAQADHY